MEKQEKQAKEAQLDLLIELKRICDKYSINYFLVGGTLIGAIRHDGFIPWDDDIDVGMIRDQYEKFINACNTELDKQYQLYDWNVDSNSPISFLKLKIKGTHYTEKLAKTTKMNDEIFIDIFPYDNAPCKKMAQLHHNINNIIIKKSLFLKLGFRIDENKKGLKKIAYCIIRIISSLKSVEEWKGAYERNAMKYNESESKYLVSLGGAYSYKRELKERELLNTFVLHRFENKEFLIPEKFDCFLKEVYGDYMKLPPVEQQISKHGVCLIDLGDYSIRNNI